LAEPAGSRTEDSMSDKHAQAHSDGSHDGPHEGPIRTPTQLIWTVLASFVVPVVVIIMLVNFVELGGKPGAGNDSLGEEAVALRLQRVGRVELRDASAPAVLRSGEQVYVAQCAACHATGAAGAPKFGDKAAWGPRLPSGMAALLNSALKGKNAMPAQGGGETSDFEISRAVVHMANQAGGKLEEPKAPAPAASAP
jgi:cytochrome c5